MSPAKTVRRCVGWHRGLACCALLLAVWLAPVAPAVAHSVNVYAWVEGETVHGEVYFRGHAPAADVKITAFDPQGNKLAETVSDRQGEFTLPARARCEHRIVADAGDGHGAEYRVPAEDFPNDLPEKAPDAAATGGSAGGGEEQPAAVGDAADATAAGSAVNTATADGATAEAAHTHDGHMHFVPAESGLDPLEAAVQRGVHSAIGGQIQAIRRQLQEDEQRTQLRDVIGGIGYILGVLGILAYLQSRRRSKADGP